MCSQKNYLYRHIFRLSNFLGIKTSCSTINWPLQKRVPQIIYSYFISSEVDCGSCRHLASEPPGVCAGTVRVRRAPDPNGRAHLRCGGRACARVLVPRVRDDRAEASGSHRAAPRAHPRARRPRRARGQSAPSQPRGLEVQQQGSNLNAQEFR